jgi:hypothetical protein
MGSESFGMLELSVSGVDTNSGLTKSRVDLMYVTNGDVCQRLVGSLSSLVPF